MNFETFNVDEFFKELKQDVEMKRRFIVNPMEVLEELFLRLPESDPDCVERYKLYVQKYEDALGELYDAIPQDKMHLMQKLESAVPEVSLIETKMAFKQGMMAGYLFAKVVRGFR